MHRRYITFISVVTVALFIMMPLSQLSSSSIAIDSNPTGKINPSLSNRLLSEVVNTWHVSGKTCAPSSASIESAITLKIDVTSFSESSGAGDTPLYFIVSGTTVHTDYIGGTGVYTYTCDVNSMPGNINFHAKYLSGSEFYSMHSMAPKPSVFFRNSYSTFGNSNIHVEKYIDEMGYDGNNTIYLSNVCHQPTYGIYNNINMPGTSSTGNVNGLNNTIIGNTAYRESDTGQHLCIQFNMTSAGGGNIKCARDCNGLSASSYPSKVVFSIHTSNTGGKASFEPQCIKSYGLNITDETPKITTESNNIANLMLDGLSVLPIAGYAVTGGEAAGTAYNLIHCLSTNYNSSNGNYANNTFYITGGSYTSSSDVVKTGQNVYAAGACGGIKIPNFDLGTGGSITIGYTTYYSCDSGNIPDKHGASTSQTFTTVTSSAIYGPILYQSNGSTDHINNKFLYIKDMNSGDFYKVPIKNGHYLFFAKPDTEYNVYYHTNNNFKFLKTIDASDLTAGNSYHYRISSDEL